MKAVWVKRRRGALAKEAISEALTCAPQLCPEGEGTALHDERLDAVTTLLLDSGATTVLDLGCGSGALLKRLIGEKQFTRIVGIDTSAEALFRAERQLALLDEPTELRISLRHGSFATADKELKGFDAAAMVETIEHIAPAHLSRVEHSVFAEMRPAQVVITTPNREYNVLYGIPDDEFRHADHHFEWGRPKFRSWATGVAERNGYDVSFADIGRADPLLGSPTQMAVFRLKQG